MMTARVGNEKKHTTATTNFQQLCCAFSPGVYVIELRLGTEKVSEVKEQSQAHGTCLSNFPSTFPKWPCCVCVCMCMCVCTHMHMHTLKLKQPQTWVFVMEALPSPMLLLSDNFSNCFDLFMAISSFPPSSSLSFLLPPPLAFLLLASGPVSLNPQTPKS